MAGSTNVRPSELNYVGYRGNQYDRDIVRAIPYHREIHNRIGRFIRRTFDVSQVYHILDLGVGSGLTAKVFQEFLPNSRIDVTDFSPRMLNLARQRLGKKHVRYLHGDYARLQFDQQYDIIESVIGIHHQKHTGKRKLFKKIYRLLKPGGYFVFGDLVTHRDPRDAAANHAKHYHYLVRNAHDENSLRDWAYHHMFLNELAAIEDQIDWLKEAGFEVKKEFLGMNTALLVARKPKLPC